MHLLPVLLLSLGLLLYLLQAFQFFLHDDEGGYAYAAWRISLGEVPYRDFLTPQMPAFLYWGGFLVRLFGRSFVPLRIGTAAVTLVAACLLYATNREVLGRGPAILSLGLFLIEPNVFHGARFFLPEAYMLAFELAGVYAFVLGEKRRRLRYTVLAGLFFGLSILSKLFGALPLAGCFIYLVFAWRRERRPLAEVARQGLALGGPVVLLLALVGLFFTHLTPYFFTAVFEHHVMQGAGMPLAQRAERALALYRGYFVGQPLAVLLAVVGVGIALAQRKVLPSLLVWQIPTALVFVVLSRDLYPRHLTYLAPVLATTAAISIAGLARARRLLMGRGKPWWVGAGAGGPVLALALTLVAFRPWVVADARDTAQQESDSAAFVSLIHSLSSSDEQVICDYPGLNFLAGRRSTYWAAGISLGAAQSGQVRGANLVDDIERGDVAMVLLRVSGDDPQLSRMVDYGNFRRYVQSRFGFVGTRSWTHTPRTFEIYARLDTMPLKPELTYGGDLVLDGLRLEDEVLDSGSRLKLQWRWRVPRPAVWDYHASLCLVDAAGRQWAEAHVGLVDPYTGAPTSAWTAQQPVSLEQQLTLNPAMPAGNYYLVVQVYYDGSGFMLPTGEWDGPTVGGMPALARVRVLAPTAVPDPNSLPGGATFSATPVDGLELAVSGLPERVEGGERLGFSVYWRATKQLGQDYELELCLQEGDAVRQRWQRPLVEGLPTSEWRAGELALESYDLAVEEALGQADYALWVRVLDRQGREAGRVRLAPTPPADPETAVGESEAEVEHPVTGVRFGEHFELLGYDLSTAEAGPGEKVAVTLYWAYRQPSTVDYTVFIHLLDEGSQIQGQVDLRPQGGGRLTSGWVMGDMLVDRFEVPLKEDAGGVALRIELGFYDQATGTRLPVVQGGQATGQDSLILPSTISITPACS